MSKSYDAPHGAGILALFDRSRGANEKDKNPYTVTNKSEVMEYYDPPLGNKDFNNPNGQVVYGSHSSKLDYVGIIALRVRYGNFEVDAAMRAAGENHKEKTVLWLESLLANLVGNPVDVAYVKSGINGNGKPYQTIGYSILNDMD